MKNTVEPASFSIMREHTAASLRFSVVIPTCRRNASLARCLDRLAAGTQTLPSGAYEVIVSDDGPEGGNARLFLEEGYPWVRWVAGPRKGPAANRNCGAARARGTWLVFTDDDCEPQPGWLGAFAARLDGADKPTPLVLEGSTISGDEKDHGPFFSAPTNGEGGLLWSCNLAIERRLFEEMNGFDALFPHPHLEDVDLRLRLQDRGMNFPFVRGAVVEHPPRPSRPVLKWIQTQESAYYLAAKRGVPASEYGQSFVMFLRIWVQMLRACRNGKEALISTVQVGAGMVLNAIYWPFWKLKYWRYPRRVASADKFPQPFSE